MAALGVGALDVGNGVGIADPGVRAAGGDRMPSEPPMPQPPPGAGVLPGGPAIERTIAVTSE
jgi:hypothetical protein